MTRQTIMTIAQLNGPLATRLRFVIPDTTRAKCFSIRSAMSRASKPAATPLTKIRSSQQISPPNEERQFQLAEPRPLRLTTLRRRLRPAKSPKPSTPVPATHGQRAVGSAAQCRRRLRKKIGITAISAAPPLRKGARPNRTAIVGCAVGSLGRLDAEGGNP